MTEKFASPVVHYFFSFTFEKDLSKKSIKNLKKKSNKRLVRLMCRLQQYFGQYVKLCGKCIL